jgi:DNA/RNA-binding domain of Phe-tRNA-synthetase-like protein
MSNLSISLTNEFIQTYPDACIGFLLISASENIKQSELLQQKKQDLIVALRDRFPEKQAISSDPVIQAYQQYYQLFKSNYHVRFQVETMTVKNQDMPIRSVLVDAMFMTELKYGLLIAGHDLKQVKLPITVDCTQEFELFSQFGGNVKNLKAKDMCIRDKEKMLSCILYGPEDTSPVTMETKSVLYTIYGPQGVPADLLSIGLDDIAANIQLAMPDVCILEKKVVGPQISG